MQSLQAVVNRVTLQAGVPDHGPWPVPSHNFHDAKGRKCLFGGGQKAIRFEAILHIGVLRRAYFTAQLPRRGIKWLHH